MDKDRFEQLIGLELDGELTPEERVELERACQADTELRRLREDDRAMIALLRRRGPERAPVGFTEQVMKRLDSRPQTTESETAGSDHLARQATPGPSSTGPAVAAEPSSRKFEQSSRESRTWWSALFGAPALRWGFGLAVPAILIFMLLELARQPGVLPERSERIFAEAGPERSRTFTDLQPTLPPFDSGERAAEADPQVDLSELMVASAESGGGATDDVSGEAEPESIQPGPVALDIEVAQAETIESSPRAEVEAFEAEEPYVPSAEREVEVALGETLAPPLEIPSPDPETAEPLALEPEPLRFEIAAATEPEPAAVADTPVPRAGARQSRLPIPTTAFAPARSAQRRRVPAPVQSDPLPAEPSEAAKAGQPDALFEERVWSPRTAPRSISSDVMREIEIATAEPESQVPRVNPRLLAPAEGRSPGEVRPRAEVRPTAAPSEPGASIRFPATEASAARSDSERRTTRPQQLRSPTSRPTSTPAPRASSGPRTLNIVVAQAEPSAQSPAADRPRISRDSNEVVRSFGGPGSARSGASIYAKLQRIEQLMSRHGHVISRRAEPTTNPVRVLLRVGIAERSIAPLLVDLRKLGIQPDPELKVTSVERSSYRIEPAPARPSSDRSDSPEVIIDVVIRLAR